MAIRNELSSTANDDDHHHHHNSDDETSFHTSRYDDDDDVDVKSIGEPLTHERHVGNNPLTNPPTTNGIHNNATAVTQNPPTEIEGEAVELNSTDDNNKSSTDDEIQQNQIIFSINIHI